MVREQDETNRSLPWHIQYTRTVHLLTISRRYMIYQSNYRSDTFSSIKHQLGWKSRQYGPCSFSFSIFIPSEQDGAWRRPQVKNSKELTSSVSPWRQSRFISRSPIHWSCLCQPANGFRCWTTTQAHNSATPSALQDRLVVLHTGHSMNMPQHARPLSLGKHPSCQSLSLQWLFSRQKEHVRWPCVHTAAAVRKSARRFISHSASYHSLPVTINWMPQPSVKLRH